MMIYSRISVEGRPDRPEKGTGGMVNVRSVSTDYFKALRIPIEKGRAFTEADRNAVIVSHTLAQRLFRHLPAVGKKIRPGGDGEWRTIIGVASDVRNAGLIESVMPEYYLPRQPEVDSTARRAFLIVRANAPPALLAASVRGVVGELDPYIPVKLETLSQAVNSLSARPRFQTAILTAFAMMALLIAAIGLYGVVSLNVMQRTAEIGIRKALGAGRGRIIRLILLQSAKWVFAGAAAGIAVSLWAGRYIETLLYGVKATDAAAFTLALTTLLIVSAAASIIPSLRAARLDPVAALRHE